MILVIPKTARRSAPLPQSREQRAKEISARLVKMLEEEEVQRHAAE